MCFLQQGLSHWVKSCNFLLPMVLTVHFFLCWYGILLTPQREKAEGKLNNVAGSEAGISCLLTPDPVLKLQATAHLGANAPLSHSWVPFSGQLYVDYLTVRKRESEQPLTQQIFIALPWCAEVWECLPYKVGHCIALFFFWCCVGFWNGPWIGVNKILMCGRPNDITQTLQSLISSSSVPVLPHMSLSFRSQLIQWGHWY